MFEISAGGVFGLVMNVFVFLAIWTGLGAVVDRLGAIFNMEISLLPTMQDAVNGFTILQTIYGMLAIIVFITLIINYFINENSLASGEV